MLHFKRYYPIVLLATAILIGLPTLLFEYALDDIPRLLDNRELRSLSNIPKAFLTPNWPGNLYRPFETVIYSLLYFVGEYRAVIYHLLNILLHAACVVALYYLLLHIVDTSTAFFSALIFSVQPIHSEVIANISYHTESAACLFSLLTCVAVLNYFSQNSKRLVRLLAIFTALMIALFTKESAFHILALAPLCIYFCRNSKVPPAKLLAVLLVVGSALVLYLGFRYIALGNEFLIENKLAHDNPLVKLEPAMRALNAISLLGRYVLQSVFPYDLSALSTFPSIVPARSLGLMTFPMWSHLTLAILLLLTGICGIAKRRKYSFFALWFFCSFFLTSNIFFAIGTIYGERLAYLASAGICGLIAQSLMGLSPNMRVIGIAAVLSFYSASTFFAIGSWRNNLTLSEHEALNSPRCSLAHRIYGEELFKEDRFREALPELEEAVRLYKFCTTPMKYLALSYFHLGDYGSSEKWALEYSAVFPQDSENQQLLNCLELIRQPEGDLVRSGCRALVPLYTRRLREEDIDRKFGPG